MSWYNDFTGKADGEFEQPSQSMDPIPDNTDVIAIIEEAKWQDGHEDKPRHISIKWKVVRPETYLNRVVFQKIHINDEKKQRNAKQMLEAIDGNAKNALTKAIAKRKGEPTDEDLAKITGATMQIKIGEWELNDMVGNWVKAVRPQSSAAKVETKKDDGFDPDDIPF
jgi:hypothetical protein